MTSLMDSLSGLLQGGQLKELSSALGTNSDATKKAVSAALPTILAAIQRNSEGGKAEALDSALSKKHDGGILDDVAGFFKKGETKDGNGILGHVLGQRRPAVEQGIAKASGLDAGSVAKLLPMLAPVVMGALGKKKREEGLQPADLSRVLKSEREEIERKAPATGGMFAKLLDQDGDGDVDMSDLGKGVLGKLFR